MAGQVRLQRRAQKLAEDGDVEAPPWARRRSGRRGSSAALSRRTSQSRPRAKAILPSDRRRSCTIGPWNTCSNPSRYSPARIDAGVGIAHPGLLARRRHSRPPSPPRRCGRSHSRPARTRLRRGPGRWRSPEPPWPGRRRRRRNGRACRRTPGGTSARPSRRDSSARTISCACSAVSRSKRELAATTPMRKGLSGLAMFCRAILWRRRRAVLVRPLQAFGVRGA